MKAFYHGCWTGPGHFWHAMGGGLVEHPLGCPFLHWIDTGYAPRRFKYGRLQNRGLVKDPSCCFAMEGLIDDHRKQILDDTNERLQGEFLIHKRDGWTLMAWWDRTHGDTRGTCNGALVVHGNLLDSEMYDVLVTHFSKIAEDLVRAGVVLVHVGLIEHG